MKTVLNSVVYLYVIPKNCYVLNLVVSFEFFMLDNLFKYCDFLENEPSFIFFRRLRKQNNPRELRDCMVPFEDIRTSPAQANQPEDPQRILPEKMNYLIYNSRLLFLVQFPAIPNYNCFRQSPYQSGRISITTEMSSRNKIIVDLLKFLSELSMSDFSAASQAFKICSI